jgi:type IV pilus assembly protein PilC
MNKKTQLQFMQRSAVLLESGVSLLDTLIMIERLETNKRNKAILNKVVKKVGEGLPLSKSLAESGCKFEPTLVSMITFGESAGLLAQCMRQGLGILEKGNHVKNKLLGALVYPGFILLATIGMTSFLVMYIFPKIVPLFSSMNIQLPLLTRIVQWIYQTTLSYGLYVFCAFLMVVSSSMWLYKKKKQFKKYFQLALLRIPLIGVQLKKYNITISCQSVGTLLESGQKLPLILEQVSAGSSLEIYKEIWNSVRLKTIEGATVSSELKRYPKFVPAIIPDMLSIGEKTGTLATMFLNISRMYEEELDEFCKHLSSSIEPVLMIGMGLVVGSIALSIILPIYEVTNHLTH